jgi:hypothetical protein
MQRCVAGLLFLTILAARAVVAMPNEPGGFGRLRFGASAAAAQQAFPQIKLKGTEQFLALYELGNQSMLGLRPCKLDLRFVDDRLYEIQFACEPRDKVLRALRKQYGAPTQQEGAATSWLGEKRTVVFSPRSAAFTFTDRALGQVANQKLLRYILTRQAQGQPIAPSPQPTP